MFSATWPEEVRSLATDFQSNPIFINIGSSELSANSNIKQTVTVVDIQDKEDNLLNLISELTKQVNIIFYFFFEYKF